MPLYDGTEVLRMLRKRFLNHPIKILALTGDARPELCEALTRDSANAYMIKPVRLAALHEEEQRPLALYVWSPGDAQTGTSHLKQDKSQCASPSELTSAA